MDNTRLFTPMRLGTATLKHRTVMAPLTRYRCDDNWIPLSMVKEYYLQRACVPGTLLITEATIVSPSHAGRLNVPGIWSAAQIAAWKEITDAVHAKGCQIWCQLWAQGRAGLVHALEVAKEKAGGKGRLMSSSAVPLTAEGSPMPTTMALGEIEETIEDYASAARNAIEAGFDGCEIHGGNGYLPDQFLQTTCNKRLDRWGGSIENRSRFHLAVANAIVSAIGAERTAIRLSPWSDYLDMLMPVPETIATFTHVVAELAKLKLAYLSLIEARITGNDDTSVSAGQDVSGFVKTWASVCPSSPVLISGGFSPKTAREAVDVTYKDYDVGIVFGRHFVSNPDLVYRVQHGIPLERYDRGVFYTPGLKEGYINYAFSKQYLEEAERQQWLEDVRATCTA
ncbi:hypothetical protein LTR62_005778 [Meristemomyces frigidus]|uniref:NADH:flavin oxidoreductase/NADH oxidase N-terminal domain-containing protein n=1 Tax=Meristemomyces frigidus TaxID=1508187 RepID=A0AAN7YN71_9PEZI|nr:hypothetical protein LTR62_005778 [Meristemomyces frigidus]